MSVRLMKKVLKEHEEARLQQNLSSGDESESPPPSRPSINPFDLLLDDDDNDQENEPESEIATETSLKNANANDKECSVKAFVNTVSPSNQRSKKKKKKKNKEDTFASKKNSEKHLDVVSENLSPGHIQVKQISSILQVDPKFLNAENELRRIFGSKVVNSFGKNNQTGTSRQNHGGRRGSHKLHRKTILVSPLEHWPRWDGSLSMELLETRDGYHYFSYVHLSSYRQAQSAFEAAKAIHDLNGIASILVHHPYHLDSLITLAEYFKFSGEHQMSADATSKCLYALECAWHPIFTPLHDNCRLKYSHETNKPMFSALFAHMKNMDRRGCHRCALEICKLLLSLDSDDPTGAMFCIDYFALRAEEYTWLERFSEEYKRDNSLWLYPNFSYSLAICRFCLECSSNDDTAAAAEMEKSGKAPATDLMLQALMLHPSVIKKLVTKVPLKDQMWTTNILKHSFFAKDEIGILSLDHLINIYVERSYIIWRLPGLQQFLRDSALKVLENLEHNKSDAKDWKCVREDAFSSDKNEYCYLSVTDFSDTVPTMPPDNLQNFMAVDPRAAMEMQNVDQVVNPPGGVRDIANQNPLAVFFESMLPWIDYGRHGGGEDGQHDEDDD